jgi:hypothetical protein
MLLGKLFLGAAILSVYLASIDDSFKATVCYLRTLSGQIAELLGVHWSLLQEVVLVIAALNSLLRQLL